MFSSAWKRLCGFIGRHEKKAQVLAAGSIAASGDLMCQLMEMRLDDNAKVALNPAHKRKPLSQCFKDLELRRLAAVGCFGLFFAGPIGAFWYPGLDKFMVTKLPHFKRGGVKFVATKVLLEEICLGPLFTGLFFITVGVGEGNTPKAIWENLRQNYLKTLVVDEIGWCMISPITYALIPIKWQLVWNSTISAVEAAGFSYVQHNGFPGIPFLGIKGVEGDKIPLPGIEGVPGHSHMDNHLLHQVVESEAEAK